MNILKRNLFKNLALVLAIASLGLFLMVGEASAASGQESKVRQVKVSSSPAVYYLDYSHGFRKAYISEAAFLSYGNSWSDIKIISQTELDKWPEVFLVKTHDSNQVYFISQGQKFLIESEQQFLESGFQWSDIVTISQIDLDAYKSADFKDSGITGNYNSQVSAVVDLAKAPAGYLVAGTQGNLMAVFNLQALNQPVQISRLVLDLKGVFNQELIEKIYLTDGNDIEYPIYSLPNNRQAVFNFNGQPIVVRQGESSQIKVYVNLYDSSADILNHTLEIAINQASNISGARAIGAFPLDGETFKLTSSSGLLEKVVASEQTLAIDDNQAIIGSTDKIIGKFTLAEVSGKNDVFIKELKFANDGSAGAASLDNFRLKNKSGQVIATLSQLSSDRELLFKLDDYKIRKGSSEVFTILANVAGGEDSTVNFQLDRIKVLSSQGNFNLPVSISNINESITIKRESLGVIAKELTPSSKIFTEQRGVIIGSFEIRNNNQAISLNRLNFSLEKSGTMPGLTETVYLVDYNSGKVYGYFNGARFNNGAVNVDLSSLALTAKQNLRIALITEIPDSAPNGGYYKVVLNTLSYRSSSGLAFLDAANSGGARLIVNKSSIYLYPNNEFTDKLYIKGQKNVKIASFIIEGAAGSDTKITDLTFSQGQDSSGIISFDNGFSNLRFYIGSSLVKLIKNPYSGDLAVGSFNYTLRSGARAEIRVYADIDKDLKASAVQLSISSLSAVNPSSLIPASVNNLNVNSHLVSFGQVSAEISRVADGFVTQGVDDNVIAGFRVKNTGAEDLSLTSIIINAADQELTYSLGYSNLRIVNRGSGRSAGSVSRPVSGANKVSLGGQVIKPGEEVVFDVHVKTSNLIADQNVNIYFSDFTAQGRSSRISALISGDPTDSFSFVIATGGR